MNRLRADLEPLELMRLAPAAGVVAVWTYLMFDAGGFRPGTWLPAGLVMLALLVLAALSSGRLLPVAGPARYALLVLVAFSSWCYISTLWSDAPGDTFRAADMLLVSLLSVWTLALAPWRARTAWLLLMAYSSVAAAVCLAELMFALGESDLTSRFEDLRFMPPLDYPNSTAAFAFMAAIPPLLQAARPDASIPAKACGQALATFLATYALLPQSRGAVLGGLAAIAVLAIAVSFRWRLVLHAGLLAAGLLAAAGPAGDVYAAAATTGQVSDSLSVAATTIIAATLFAGLAGAALAYAESRIRLDDDRRHGARLAGFALTGLLVVVLLIVGVAKSDAISEAVSDQWRSLKSPGVEFSGDGANQASGRLTSIDPLERYDYWRVSVAGFRGAPLWGMGAGAFEHHYTIERRYPKMARYPHNLPLKVLGDTGLIGLGLMLAYLAIVAAGLLRARSGARRAERVVAAGAVSMLAYFIAHGSFDWLEAYPVLVGPALGFPLVALVVVARERRAPAPAARRAVVGAVLAAALAAVALLAPWLSLRYRERATAAWRTNAAEAYRDLERAADLEPLSAEAPMLLGVIGLARGDLTGARRGFETALEREQDWLPHFGLGVIAAATGDDATARRELAVARRLNPRDRNLPSVTREVLTDERVVPAKLIRDVLVAPSFEAEPLS